MLISTHTYSGESCIGAKRIYSNKDDLILQWICPECEYKHNETFNQVPLISYGNYCHSYYCDECGFEDSEKMYTLNNIYTNDVDITVGSKHNLKCFRIEPKLVEIKENNND